MEDGSYQSDRDELKVSDETSLFLSPSVRRHPMTYFVYPGLDAPNLKGFLLQNQASTACIQKAMDDLGRSTPCPSIHNLSDNISEENLSSISDEVFIDDVLEIPDKQNGTVINISTADETLLDEVPLETPADDTELADNQCKYELPKANDVVPFKERKGLSKFFVSLCACGGFKASKHKSPPKPTTEL